MRRFMSIWLVCFYFINLSAQTTGNFQLGIMSGANFPVNGFKSDIGRAKLGYGVGIFADKYFLGSNFGLGVDMRYLKNKGRGLDTIKFADGFLAANYNKPNAFKNYVIALGPIFKSALASWLQLELFLKGGLMLEDFPSYNNKLTYAPYVSGSSSIIVRQTINAQDKTTSFMGLGGMRLNFKLSRNLGLFLSGDYLRTFGEKFSNKPSKFGIASMNPLVPITSSTFIYSPAVHYDVSNYPEQRIFITMVNAMAGVKLNFNRKPSVKTNTSAKTNILAPVYNTSAIANVSQQTIKKDIVVLVKDRQTGIALSGVRVLVKAAGKEYVSLTNANGEAERIVGVAKNNYHISGEKNGIYTTESDITTSDFDDNTSNIIYRELYHNDPRFTLIGETVSCKNNLALPGINTILTQNSTKQNQSQISDKYGKFIYELDANAHYSLIANEPGKYSQTEIISTYGLDRSKTMYVTLKLGICNVEAGSVWIVKNIFYDFDKSNIRPDAAIILDNLVHVMKNNPSLTIELSSHTDSRGNDDYNLRLSQRRADAAVAYLVSNGIEKGRMKSKGYGESRLVNNCGNNIPCSEEDHQQNRRTEIKFLQY